MPNNDRLLAAYEKNKERLKQSPKTARDWLPLAMSALSLAVALLTAAITLIPRDDVRVMVDRPPALVLEKKIFSVFGKPELTFINSGNRAIGISDLAASSQRLPKNASVSHCKRDDNNDILFPVLFDNPPFVLNPGEIRVLEPSLRTDAPGQFEIISKGKNGEVLIPAFGVKDGDELLICFELRLVTPDSYVRTWHMLAYSIKIHDGMGEFTPLFDQKKPIVIHRGAFPNL
jgi:hypothetical protein